VGAWGLGHVAAALLASNDGSQWCGCAGTRLSEPTHGFSVQLYSVNRGFKPVEMVCKMSVQVFQEFFKMFQKIC
jgi:hypothetical protein